MEFAAEINDISPNPSYVKNAQGLVVLANKAFANLHGTTVEALLAKGKLDADYSHEKDMELINTNGTLSFDEFFNLRNGKKIWFRTIKKAFPSTDGSTLLLSTSVEITALKTKVLEANASTNYEEVILTNLVHELRSSLNVIIETNHHLIDFLPENGQNRYYKTINHHSGNLLFFLNNFLDFYKTLTCKIKLESVPFQVETIIRDTVSGLSRDTEELKAPLRFLEPGKTLPLVLGDPLRLTQVIINFVRFTQEFARGGQILLSVTDKEKSDSKIYLEFTIEHLGTAINLEKFKKVANSFGQTLKRNYSLDGNLNFKLKLCKDLIALQGGNTWLKRNGGFGYSFFFKIPFPVSVAPAMPQHLDEKGEKMLRGRKVLLAEDNEVNQLMATSYMHSWGVLVDTVYNGEEALVKAHEQKYDLILMDIQMPKINGFEVTHCLKTEDNPNQNTPIIAFTANVLKNDVEQFKEFGFDGYLIKPYEKAQLYQLLLNHQNQQDQGQHAAADCHDGRPEEAEPPLYDFSDLGHLAHDAIFIRKMQQLFRQRAPEQLDLLSNAYQHNNRETIAQIAHNLKSTYGNIKVMGAAEALRKIEDIARSENDMEPIPELLDIVYNITDKVLAKLEEEGVSS